MAWHKPRPFMRFLSAILSLLFLLALLAGAGGFYVLQKLKEPGPLAAQKNIVIPRGLGASTIARQLEKEGVIASSLFFRLRYRLNGEPELKAGEYSFPAAVLLNDVIAKMAQGDVVIHKFTLAEGLTSADAVRILNAESALGGSISFIPPEGSLLPDTYLFTLAEERTAQIAQMQKAMVHAVAEAWAQRDADTPLQTVQQLVTLASIVEKETGKPEERARVAGVYINRLRKGMLLQADPTVVYGITLGQAPLGRALLYADLDKVTPYNTYRVVGLPPTPITNPGKAALMASARPEKHDYLYFVADGTGGHRFAATLEEHNKNVAAWRKVNAVKP